MYVVFNYSNVAHSNVRLYVLCKTYEHVHIHIDIYYNYYIHRVLTIATLEKLLLPCKPH